MVELKWKVLQLLPLPSLPDLLDDFKEREKTRKCLHRATFIHKVLLYSNLQRSLQPQKRRFAHAMVHAAPKVE